MANHTEGKWEVGWDYIVNEPTILSGKTLVAILQCDNRKVSEANARLIAAAPAMHEALNDLSHDFTTLAQLYGLSPDKINAVLAKSKQALAETEGLK